MDTLNTLAAISADLTATLRAEDRYIRLLAALHRAIPYDAATLLRVDGEVLTVLAARGLTPDALGREYRRSIHPRLDIICGSRQPVIFSKDSPLPDPFDGLLEGAPEALHHIHACLGCPLHVGDRLAGVLCADALDPGAFDKLPFEFLGAVGSMAAAQLHTADLLSALEDKAERQGQIASDLMRGNQRDEERELIGNSPELKRLRREVELVGRSDFTSLVHGETGVGKELVARALHRHSERRHTPMLYLNCAALPASLAESELFGHQKGAFTGATENRTGKFELADGGTLFLDEIGELPLDIQAKLLRAIQEGEVQKIGSSKPIRVDVRLIAATNRNLEDEVAAGRFRADLYHRLNVYPVRVAPLREHKEDIGLLAGFFCERMQQRLGIGGVRIAAETLELLHGYDWPGNVRELENLLSRAVLKASAGAGRKELVLLQPGDFPADLGQIAVAPSTVPTERIASTAPSLPLREAVRQLQIQSIREALAANGNSWAAAARQLGMHRSNLHNLATRLGLRN